MDQIEKEMLSYDTMANVIEFVKKYGCKEFKNSLKSFNNDIYEEIFFPQTKSAKCYLTNRN